MPELHSNRRLDQPRAGRSRRFAMDPDAFARMSERVARFLGTGRFLAIQTVIVAIWITLNLTALVQHWDPYPFILLNLFLSMLAAIQAPVIMMSQNRQDHKDRVRSELDYDVNRRAETEIQALTRKLNSIADKVDDLDEHIRVSKGV